MGLKHGRDRSNSNFMKDSIVSEAGTHDQTGRLLQICPITGVEQTKLEKVVTIGIIVMNIHDNA
jgi:hypothetical protein